MQVSSLCKAPDLVRLIARTKGHAWEFCQLEGCCRSCLGNLSIRMGDLVVCPSYVTFANGGVTDQIGIEVVNMWDRTMICNGFLSRRLFSPQALLSFVDTFDEVCSSDLWPLSNRRMKPSLSTLRSLHQATSRFDEVGLRKRAKAGWSVVLIWCPGFEDATWTIHGGRIWHLVLLSVATRRDPTTEWSIMGWAYLEYTWRISRINWSGKSKHLSGWGLQRR